MRAIVALIALALLTPPPPPPPPAQRLTVEIAAAARAPAWVVLRADGVRVLDATTTDAAGFCAYGPSTIWCEVSAPASIEVAYAPRGRACAAGLRVEVDKRPAGWRSVRPARAYLPAAMR